MTCPIWVWASYLGAAGLRFFASSVLGNLVATLIGVFLAFQLAHWRERRRARDDYARLLSAVRYELSDLHAICEQSLESLNRGGITSYEIDAPALTLLVSGSALQAYAPHGLTVVLRSLAVFVGGTNNIFRYFRMQMALRQPLTDLAPLRRHLEQLRSGISNAQVLIDRELGRFNRGVIETDQDQADIAGFRSATRTTAPPCSSAPPSGSQGSSP